MKFRRRALTALLAAGFLVAGVIPVVANDLEDELADVESAMDEIAAAASAASNNRSSVIGEIQTTETTMAGLLADLGQTRFALSLVGDDLIAQRAHLDGLRSELRDLYLELTDTRTDLDDSQVEALEWAVALYKTAGTKEAGVALVAEDLSSVSVGLAYLDRISETTDAAIHRLEALQQLEERQQERIEQREAAAEAEVERLDEMEQQLRALESQLAEQQAAVEAELANQKRLLRSIEEEIEHFETELAGLEAEQGRIRQAIADAAAKAKEKEEDDAGGGEVGGGEGATSGFVRPVPGPISSSFGPRLHPILGYSRMHTGVDFSAPHGQSIKATAAGTVIMATSFGGYGNTVVIDHGGGVTSLYAHQSSIAVGTGAWVGGGDVVGHVGSTGLSTGPHLHFEIRVEGTPVDPMQYL